MPQGIAIVWLPNALILATFLLKEKKEWLLFIFVFLISEIIADLGSFTLIQSLQFGFINVCEGLLSTLLIKKLNKNSVNFQNIKYVITFISIALITIPAFSALFGALVYKTQIENNNKFFAILENLVFW
jgi:integral membrane sensor domain MASE1